MAHCTCISYFSGDHPDSSVRNVVTHIKDRLEESETLQQQAQINTLAQFSASPDLQSEFVDAVIRTCRDNGLLESPDGQGAEECPGGITGCRTPIGLPQKPELSTKKERWSLIGHARLVIDAPWPCRDLMAAWAASMPVSMTPV